MTLVADASVAANWFIEERGRAPAAPGRSGWPGENFWSFFLTVFSKGERTDLTKSERNALAQLTKVLVDSYRASTGRLG